MRNRIKDISDQVWVFIMATSVLILYAAACIATYFLRYAGPYQYRHLNLQNGNF